MTSDQVSKDDQGGTRAISLFALILFCLSTHEIHNAIRMGFEDFSKPVRDVMISVNSDPEEKLRLLPGVGTSISNQVIRLRSYEPFAGIDDFEARVRGVGPAFIANSGPHLDFSTASTQEWVPQAQAEGQAP
ncbi:MAG: hypothetical protein ACKO5E_10570 [bacterium]